MKESTRNDLNEYIKDRVPVGDFLYAVLTNNLVETYARADEENLYDLFEIVSYVYNQLPSECWGSKEKVDKWLLGREEIKCV